MCNGMTCCCMYDDEREKLWQFETETHNRPMLLVPESFSVAPLSSRDQSFILPLSPQYCIKESTAALSASRQKPTPIQRCLALTMALAAMTSGRWV